ncbi:MAG: hypothetical protein NVV73_06380 [Cellvibrionaceae bacterium]|nr:hypothetical protein [Cellvibrionaceae bacterium]
MKPLIRLLLTFVVVGFQSYAHAQGFTPSPEQIQQFKNMSPAQQQQMAEAAGIDLNALIGAHQKSAQPVLGEDSKTPEAQSQRTQKDEAKQEAEDKSEKKILAVKNFPCSAAIYFRATWKHSVRRLTSLYQPIT